MREFFLNFNMRAGGCKCSYHEEKERLCADLKYLMKELSQQWEICYNIVNKN